MLEVQLNGQPKQLEESLTLQEILDRFQIQPQAIAVAVNAEIIPRSELDKIRVRNGDKIEVVRAVGGG